MIRYCHLVVLVSILAVVNASIVTLNKAEAYKRTAGYPIACACAEDGVTTEECNLFQCACSCDVTAGVCDYNCCCDPDCSAEQKTRFAEVGCAAEGYSPDKTQLCYDSLELYKINPKLPLGGEPTTEASVGGALCVEKYNGATEIDYFTDTSVQSTDIFTVAAGKKDYYYGDSFQNSGTLDSSFDQGDSIAAFLGVDTTAGNLYSTDTGFFSIPAADVDGRCNDNNFAGFEQDIESRSCQRELASATATISLYEAQCEKDFSMKRYVEDLYLASAANVRATTANPTAIVAVTIGTVTHLNQATNVATDVTTLWNTNSCATTWHADKTNYAATGNCLFVDTSSLPDVPYCQNIVTSVSYTVTHDATTSGTITSVTANVVLTDFAQDVNVATQTFTQSFGVDFVSTFGGTTSEGSGNLVTRSKSGNPGYLMGKPVLVGELQAPDGSTLSTIGQSTDGFQVASSLLAYDATNAASFGSAKCPVNSAKGYQTIGFGYDMTTGCQLELTRAELNNLCCIGSSDCTAGATSYAGSDGWPYFLELPTADQYVGVYGNADPLDVSQWTKMNKRTTSANSNWNDNTGVCTNMKSGLHYKFLVASSGEKNFPQSKIVGVEVEQTVSDWYSNVPYDDVVSTQTFSLEVTASFVYKESADLQGYVPPAPPVLFKVPHDVFYPFFMSPAAPKPTVSLLSLLAPVACTLVLVSVQGFFM